MKLAFTLLIAALLFVATFGFLEEAKGGEPLHVVRVTSKTPYILSKLLRSRAYDVVAHDEKGVNVITSDKSLKQLYYYTKSRQPFIANIQLLDTREQSGVNNDLYTLFTNITMPNYLAKSVPEGYRDFAKITAILKNLGDRYPDLVNIIDLNKQYGTGLTVDGNSIYAIKISTNVKQNLDKDNVLIASCHHSRETITPEIALIFAQDLIDRYTSGDATIVKLLQTTQIFVIPVVNVDGFKYTYEKNNWWRKNRKLDETTKEYGVDLNRNYDLGWEDCGGSKEPSSEIYRGPSVLSEVETQAIVALSKDYSFSKVLDFHSSGREVLTAYTCTKMPEVMRKYIVDRGMELMKYASYGHRVPSDDGEHQEHQIKHHTSYSFLVETGTSFQPAYTECLQEVKRVLPLIYHFLNVSIPLKGHVKNTHNQSLEARISVKGIDWLAGETRRSNPRFGAYHLFLPAGATFNVTFEAAGYQSQDISVTLSKDAQYGSVTKDVVLKEL
ncbi:carboxypeptidase [Acrasis kona]|uniref:Carboxypeptidase n=1 Tax=Acrasis kona TaxID=1008807 RepID=A0AAW2Z9P7_9EUKA